MTAETPRGMSPRIRLALFGVAVLVVLPGVVRVAGQMPGFGVHPLPYGDAINAAAPPERHVTNMTSAVNFDYRGFDTLGEECCCAGSAASSGAPGPAAPGTVRCCPARTRRR